MANRIDGIVSGLDTESLIKGMLSYQQSQIDRLKKNNQVLSWQRTRYTDIYNKIDAFRTKMYDYKLDSKTVIKSALSSNDSYVSAKASSEAAVGTHTIRVHELASGAQAGSQQKMGSSTNKTNLQTQFVESDGTTPKYTGTFDIVVNGKTINVDTSKSMNDLVKQINNSGAGVTASYDANIDRFFISSKETGAEAKIDFTGTDTDGRVFLRDALKMPTITAEDIAEATDGSLDGKEGWLKLTVAGKDAKFDLDGITGLTQSTNEFTISGITYNLKEADPSKSATVTVNNDSDAIYQSVVDFVSMYNELLEEINGVVYEQKQKGYEALTDDQKSAMTAEQIKTWEDNAQKGILRSDSILMGVRNNMRTIIYSSVNGISSQMVNGKRVTYNSLFAIGLKTGDYSTNGKLEIDETKLKAAIEADPDAVNKIFNGGTNADGTRTEGVADKLYDSLKLGMDKINDKSGAAAGGKETTSTLAKKIANNEKAINAKVTRYNNQMATYYKQFDAMEKLLQQLQSQQDSLYNYLGG